MRCCWVNVELTIKNIVDLNLLFKCNSDPGNTTVCKNYAMDTEAITTLKHGFWKMLMKAYDPKVSLFLELTRSSGYKYLNFVAGLDVTNVIFTIYINQIDLMINVNCF